MEWKLCSGSGQPAMKSEPNGGRAMCPVCTKYVPVHIGQRVPSHDSIVIDSAARNLQNYPTLRRMFE